ncbi:hypothetical protein B0I00_0888 [Novosphingobium kunmingense]|uniref:Uncharacterized protein n=1 Tax=Novosphingobium kunmingense TaxID=1211806 RepID=A0A2N0I3C0_9SPHN|nr:hypothetical protein [Novosphingobium kunmingense]PKB25682.1 hypothetical protein B0I00_0888 [Novosphingobium kunmingense]
MKRVLLFAGGGLLALSSVWAAAQDSPESLLPPGFERPKAPPKQDSPAPNPAASPVVQPLPSDSSRASSAGPRPITLPSGMRIPTLRELEAMTPDELDELLGLKPKFDMPGAARRSLDRVGVLAADEGGLPPLSVRGQSPVLVKAAIEGNKGQMVSRWGHILVRRALASRMDAPQGMNPADFAAARTQLLLRMGEGEAARALVQDVDAGNYTPGLTQAALDAFAFTADVTGVCPVIAVHGSVRRDPDWRVLRSLCASFQGDGSAGMAQLTQMERTGVWPQIDILLAKKYAGAIGKSRQAVTIEWDKVEDMKPWRYALAIGVGLEPPARLTDDNAVRYGLINATAPMLPLTARAAGADRAAGAGILSAAAMVDLYGQIYAQEDIEGEWADRAASLRTAYVGEAPADRLAAIKALWSDSGDAQARYSRQVLTAYAAARMPVDQSFSADAPDLIASMLAAGLDANALRWLSQAEPGSLAWGQLALAAPTAQGAVDAGALDDFYDNDTSNGYRKSRFLLAGLAGLGRVDAGVAGNFAAKLGIDPARQTRWTALIDQAAAVDNQALVVLLAGVGMQGDGWDKMTSVNLFHIVNALNKVGLSAEARMIAAEAVARA